MSAAGHTLTVGVVISCKGLEVESLIVGVVTLEVGGVTLLVGIFTLFVGVVRPAALKSDEPREESLLRFLLRLPDCDWSASGV